MPSTNISYWNSKIARNMERDRDTDRRFVAAGWQVLRFWEHEAPDDIADRIEFAVRAADRHRHPSKPG